MRKSTIIKHIESYWPAYGAATCAIGLLVLVFGVVAEGQRRAEVCLDRGMVVVDTSAGGRCAAPDTLERI